MINLEHLQDLHNLGVSPIDKRLKAEFQPWLKEIFEKFKIENEEDQRCLNILINNLFTKYLVQQEETKEIDEQKLKLIREMSMYELIYHYLISWDLPKIVSMQPLSNPAGLVYCMERNKSHIDMPTKSIAAKTRGCDKGVDVLFKDVQDDVMKQLYESLNPKMVAEINITQLYDYLESVSCEGYNEVLYNKTLVMDDKFAPMVSNAIIVRTFDNFNKEKIEVNGGVAMDEVLLRKHSCQFDVGVAFCPYIIPMRTTKTDCVMARYAVWTSPNIDQYYKRVKVVN